MKKLSIIISILFISIAAQATDSLQREVTIVREFTPIAREADKINTLPPIGTPTFNRSAVRYNFDATSSPITSRKTVVEMPFSPRDIAGKKPHRGYADFAMGSYLAMAANAGYHIIDTPKDKLNAGLQFTSLNGNIPVNTQLTTIPEDNTKQTFYDLRTGVNYAHIFNNNLTWSIDGAYRFLHFNYYGVTGTQPAGNTPHPLQTTHNFYVEMQLDNSEARDYDFEFWRITGGYSLYSNLGGAYINTPSQEHHAYLNGFYRHMLNNAWNVGANVDLNYLQYNGVLPIGTNLVNTPAQPTSEHIVMASILPHFEWKNSRADFSIGAKMDISVGDGTLFRFAPHLHFNWEFIENYFLYIQADGGKRLNTWNDISKYCIYFDPSQRIPSSYSPVDGRLGLRFHFIPELSLTLYGGYEVAQEALFQALGYAPQTITWRTLDAQCIKAGAQIDLNIGEYVTFSADGAYRAWQHNGYQISYNLPRWEGNARLNIDPIEKVNVNVSYNMALGRDYGNYGRLADIHNLQATVQYQPLEWLSVKLHGNNLLNRAHDYYYGMPAPGILIMGGVGLKF